MFFYYFHEGKKRRRISYDFPKIFRAKLNKRSEISINTVKNIYEVEQKSLLVTFTAKWHRYYGVSLHFLDFHRKDFPKIQPTLFLLTPPPFINFTRVVNKVGLHARHMKSLLTRKRTRKQKQRLTETEKSFGYSGSFAKCTSKGLTYTS